MGKIELYDRRNIESLVWPDTRDGQYARKYLIPLVRDGVKPYIENADTEMMIIKRGDVILPITVNCGEYENSYVCSPYTHYISYALEELRELKQPALEKFLAGIIRTTGFFLKKTQLNKVVHVNNWLLSTNLYPELTQETVKDVLIFLEKTFPEHAIVFRSLNEVTNRIILQFLKDIGCRPVASRQIYGIDLTHGRVPSLYDIKKDMKLIKFSEYKAVVGNRLSKTDIARIVDLYNMLYLDKYSYNNPTFSVKFIEHAAREKIFTLCVFRKDENIDAVIGFFEQNGVMTTSILGYDTSLPKKAGLYRLASIKIILEAARRQLYLNNSSGAAQFKRNRGASGHIEYSMVYHKHLPWRRKMPWVVLAALANKIGIPLMKKYRL